MKVLRHFFSRLALIGRSPLWIMMKSRQRNGHRRFYARGYMREEIDALRRACGE